MSMFYHKERDFESVHNLALHNGCFAAVIRKQSISDVCEHCQNHILNPMFLDEVFTIDF